MKTNTNENQANSEPQGSESARCSILNEAHINNLIKEAKIHLKRAKKNSIDSPAISRNDMRRLKETLRDAITLVERYEASTF